jgi:thiamine-phosphate pyrophosphorylase
MLNRPAGAIDNLARSTTMNRSDMRGLYPIVDVDALASAGLPALPFAEHLLAAGPPLLQLRAKGASARDTLALLRALLPLCKNANVLLFANDRPDLALLAGCDGVHVGQDDLPIDEVRRIAPNLKVGVSTHDIPELERALAERPDYVAFGPVFATSSKQNPNAVVGSKGLARAAELARAAWCPLCAIGGIEASNVEQVAPHADLTAVISALLPVGEETLDDVSEKAKRLSRALGGLS